MLDAYAATLMPMRYCADDFVISFRYMLMMPLRAMPIFAAL